MNREARWVLTDGDAVDGLQQWRMSIGAENGVWDIRVVFVPGETRVHAEYHPTSRRGRLMPSRLLAAYESSMDPPTSSARGEADLVMSQACVEWFGADAMTAHARAEFDPLGRTPGLYGVGGP